MTSTWFVAALLCQYDGAMQLPYGGTSFGSPYAQRGGAQAGALQIGGTGGGGSVLHNGLGLGGGGGGFGGMGRLGGGFNPDTGTGMGGFGGYGGGGLGGRGGVFGGGLNRGRVGPTVAHQPTYQAAALGAIGSVGRNRAIAPLGATPAPTSRTGAPLGAAPNAKWDLSPSSTGSPAATGMASLLLNGVSGGPLSEDEAHTLAATLTGAEPPTPKDETTGADLASLVHHSVDPDLSDLQSGLDALLPSLDPSQLRPIDGDALRSWFKVLDVSKDDSISFLEWRDRTGLSLDLFRRVDKSGEGLVSFDEFSRALVLNAASQSGRTIAPELVAWAEGKDGDTAAPAPAPPKAASDLSNQEALDLAAAQIAAMQQSATTPANGTNPPLDAAAAAAIAAASAKNPAAANAPAKAKAPPIVAPTAAPHPARHPAPRHGAKPAYGY